MPLAPEVDQIEGRQLKYVLKGSATEYVGEASKVYREGDAGLADKNTTHWWRNDGTEPAIFVVVNTVSTRCGGSALTQFNALGKIVTIT